jgi:secreted trypsin-like serine protease
MVGTDERGSDAAGDTGRTRVMLVVCAVVACVLGLAAPAHAGPVNGHGGGPTASASIAGGYYPAANFALFTTSIVDPTRQASNGDLGHGVCTAVLIAPQRVLTAAHCVVEADGKTPRPAGRFQVLVGRRDLTLVNQGERRNVTGVAVHPKVYLPHMGVHTNHAFYDIAVLFLDRPVTTIAPVPIGTPDDWNSWGTVLGFGHYNYDHDPKHQVYDQYLRAADFDMWGDDRCA